MLRGYPGRSELLLEVVGQVYRENFIREESDGLSVGYVSNVHSLGIVEASRGSAMSNRVLIRL